MKLDEFVKVFPAYAQTCQSIELISGPGRGKSETVRALIDVMSKREGKQWGFATMFLATQTPPDLIGYQFKGEVTYDGKTMSITDPTAPTWFMCEDGLPVFAYERGILFLDEFGQGQTDVKAAAAELLLNKRLGKWKLPDGWIVIAASNRTTDRSGVTKSLDFVINRRLEIHITDDIESWLTWARKADISPVTLAFANQYPEIVLSAGVPDKQGPWCTPRSLVMWDRQLQALIAAGIESDGAIAMETAQGLIGGAASSTYFATLRLEKEMPKFEAIVKDPKGVKVPVKPDAQMLVVYNLAHRVSQETAEAVVTYVQRMSKDFSVTFVKTAVDRMPMLIANPAIQKWCLENSALMAAIGK
jgi:hypothetical protein